MKIDIFFILKKIHNTLPRGIRKLLEKQTSNILFYRDLQIAMQKFLTKSELADTRLRKEIEKDIYQCRKIYNIKAEEYFLFGFRGKPSDYRSSFLPDNVKDSVLIRIVGANVFWNELKNKYNFFQLTKSWFGRDVMLVYRQSNIENLQEFINFSQKHTYLFIKDNSGSLGQNAGLYHVTSDKDAEKLYECLLKKGDKWIVEEPIKQTKEMALWNDSSVNTVRIPSILNGDKWTILGAFFRTGRKGSVVDNAGAGGIFACVDDDGKLTTDGIDEVGTYYVKHPDSGMTYKGWQIPRWKELVTIVEKVHRSIPWHKYIGWDFALTDNGWVLVEGNWGQFVSQYNDHIGLKKRFFELLEIDCK